MASSDVKEFITNTNFNLLLEVITSDPTVENSSLENLSLQRILKQNMLPFYEIEKNNHSKLIQINKSFITQIIAYINKSGFKSNKTEKEMITRDDIENKRMTEFEQKYNMKQNEFASAMALPIPPTPNFQDKMDAPISELELEMKRVIAARNYDIEQINSKQKRPEPITITNPKSTKMKYIKIHENDISSDVYKKDVIVLNELAEYPKKHVHWDTSDNIFSKLKRTETKTETTDEIKNITEILTKIQEEMQNLRNFVEMRLSDK